MSELTDPSKEKRPVKPISVGFLADIIRQVRLAWRLLLDSRVPAWTKILVPVTLLYIVSPVDLVPDVAVGVGQLDDLAVLVLGIKLFVELCPPAIVREHLKELLGETEWQVEPPPPQVIDAPYEVKKDE